MFFYFAIFRLSFVVGDGNSDVDGDDDGDVDA